MVRRKKTCSNRSRKHWLAAVALLAYLAGAIGFPFPMRERSGAESVAVHACGCPPSERAAGTCCCCGTPSADDSSPPSCCSSRPGKKKARAEVEIVWAAGVSAWRCQGLHPMLGGGVAALAPPAPHAWRPGTLPLSWLRSESDLPFRLVFSLPERPPRSFHG